MLLTNICSKVLQQMHVSDMHVSYSANNYIFNRYSCVDPGILVEGGGVQVNLTKKNSRQFFFSPQAYFTHSSQMVNFKENCHFSREGSPIAYFLQKPK